MNKYELLYIVGTQYTDVEVVEIQAKVVAMLQKYEGVIIRNENLAKIRLAYPIKKVRHGSYILVHFDAPPAKIQELNRQFGLMEEVLRHTLLTREPGAENKKFEISTYIAPLSEEAKDTKHTETRTAAPVREKTVKVMEVVSEPLPAIAADQVMSIEELDKKLDAILDVDSKENV